MWAPVRCDSRHDWVVPRVIQSLTWVWTLGGTFDAMMACSRCSCSCLPRRVTGWPYQNQAPPRCGGETRVHCCLRHGGIKIRKHPSKNNGFSHTHTHTCTHTCTVCRGGKIKSFSFMNQTVADWWLKYRIYKVSINIWITPASFTAQYTSCCPL